MNEWVIALEILQVVIIVIIGLFIRSYLPGYFKKKGENLATKEDIGEITEQVERIKTLYSAQMESTRSSIAQARLEKEEYLREQKSCLLRFYDLAIELMYEKLAVNFGDLPMDQGKSLAGFRNSFYELISNLIKSYQRIVVYFSHDDNLRVEAESVLTQALEARRVFKKYFAGVTIAFLNESQAFLSCENMNVSVEATNAANDQYWNAMRPVITEMQHSLRRYLTALNGFLRPNEQSQVPPAMFLADE
jgi:hypothetical protein